MEEEMNADFLETVPEEPGQRVAPAPTILSDLSSPQLSVLSKGNNTTSTGWLSMVAHISTQEGRSRRTIVNSRLAWARLQIKILSQTTKTNKRHPRHQTGCVWARTREMVQWLREFTVCGGLNDNDPHRLMCLIVLFVCFETKSL